MDQSETPFLLFLLKPIRGNLAPGFPRAFHLSPRHVQKCSGVEIDVERGERGYGWWDVMLTVLNSPSLLFLLKTHFSAGSVRKCTWTLQITRPYFIESWISRTIADISQCTSSTRLNKLSHHSETLLKWANHLQDFVRDTGRKNAIKDRPLEGWGF